VVSTPSSYTNVGGQPADRRAAGGGVGDGQEARQPHPRKLGAANRTQAVAAPASWACSR